MALFFSEQHQKRLSFLREHTPEVLVSFAQAAVDYINKGPNPKSYVTAARTFNMTTEDIQDALESLVYIFIECSKFEIGPAELKELLLAAGFDEKQVNVLNQIYEKNKHGIRQICTKTDNVQYFHDLRWRFEAKIGSRSLINQMTPLVTFDFKLADSPKAATVDKVSNCLLQTDPNTLIHVTETLEKALVLSRSRNMQKIERKIKKLIPDA